MDTLLPLSVAYFASAWCSYLAMSTTRPSFDEPAATLAPTVSARIRLDVVEHHDERRRGGGPQLELSADHAARHDPVADRDDGPVHRRVHVRSGDRASVERAESTTLELVPGPAVSRRARDPVPQPCEEPLVRLRPDRLEEERSLVRAVEADPRQPTLGDRRLEAQVPDRREHLRLGRRGLHGHRRDGRDRGGAAGRGVAERGQGERHHRDDPQQHRDRDPPCPGLRAATPCPEAGCVS